MTHDKYDLPSGASHHRGKDVRDVRGKVAGLGADCVEKELRENHRAELTTLLARAGFDDVDPSEFRRFGSERQLYNFKIDNAGAY